MTPRLTLKVMTSVLLLSSLTACFKAATSSIGNSTRVKSATTALTIAESSETKSKAEVSFNATETQTISVGKDSSIAGTSVAFAPGSLSISTSIVVEEGSSFLDADMSNEMGLSENQSISSAGAGVIIRPTTDAVLTKPLQLNLPLPSVSGLRLASTFYAITYKYLDPEKNQLVTGIKPVDGVDVKIIFDETSQRDVIQFSGYFGIYWVVTLAREMPKSEIPAPKISTTPIVNKANVSVIATNGIVKETEVLATQAKPAIVWTKPVLSFTAATRIVRLSITMPSQDFKNCRAEFHKSATDLTGLIVELGALKDAELPAPSDKTSLVARYRCQDFSDRLTASPWSDALAIPAVEIATAPVVSTPVVADPVATTPDPVVTPPAVVTPSDTIAPTVVAVSSSMANNIYSTGDTITVNVSFSEAVQITGTPALALTAGSPPISALYESGSGSTELVFSFVVAASHFTADLDYSSTTSLTGDIKDLAGNTAVLTLPTPGSAASLSGSRQIVIDNTPAAVVSLSTSDSDGLYIANQPLNILVTFTRAVDVAGGTPTINLNTSPAQTAMYMGGSGSNVLTFRYTVQTGDISPDLDVLSVSSIATNGATITDSASNAATLNLPEPGSALSLSTNHNLEIAGNADYPVLATTNSDQFIILGATISMMDTNHSNALDQTNDGRPITYTCRYDHTANNTMDAGSTDCAMLPGSFNFSASNGQLTWTPDANISFDPGYPFVFEFKFTGTNTANLTHFAYAKVSLIKPFVTALEFDTIDSGNYTFDPTKVEFVNGVARLKQVDQATDSLSEFSPPTLKGAAYDSPSSSFQLGTMNGCNGRTENCIGTDLTSLPQYGSLIHYAAFDTNKTPFDNQTDPTQDPLLSTASKKMGIGSLSFDGGDRLLLANGFADNFSINFWMQTSDTDSLNACTDWRDGKRILSVDNGSILATLYGISLCDGKISAGVSAATPVTTQSTYQVSDDKWHMVTFTRNRSSGEIRLYLDGALQHNLTGNSDILSGSGDLVLGGGPGSTNFVGGIDEFALWSSVLTQNDIERIYLRQSTHIGGSMDSSVFDTNSPSSLWTFLELATTMPFGKELVDTGVLEDTSAYPMDYSTFENNIRGLWHLNEPTGSFIDSSGNYSNGMINGSLNQASLGRFQRAPTFSGTGAISVGSGSHLSFGTSSFSVSAWFKTGNIVGTRTIFSNGYSSYNDGFTLEMIDGKIAFGLCHAGGTAGTCSKALTVDHFADGAWHHVVAYADRTSNRLAVHVDGRLVTVGTHASGTCGSPNADKLDITACSSISGNRSHSDVSIGGSIDTSPFNQWLGQLDEVAVWARTPSSSEIQNLYRRGANRVLLQVRTCPDAACTSVPFKGPDGTPQTYFSEINNNASADTANSMVTAGGLHLNFNDFANLNIGTNRYFQYRLILESDDKNQICAGSVNCSPEIRYVHVGPEHFDPAAWVNHNMPISYTTIQNFTYAIGADPCVNGVRFSLSTDQTNWYYNTGSNWVISNDTYVSTMDPSVMNAKWADYKTFSGGAPVYIRSLLTSDGTQSCSIDSYSVQANATF